MGAFEAGRIGLDLQFVTEQAKAAVRPCLGDVSGGPCDPDHARRALDLLTNVVGRAKHCLMRLHPDCR